MYLVYICGGLALFGGIALLVEKLLDIRNGNLAIARCLALIMALILAFIMILGNLSVDATVQAVTNEYADIMLYYGTIAVSDNEYVRYDFHERIAAYNQEYEDCLAESESNWLGVFYNKNWDTLCGPIDSFLTGDYNYEYDYDYTGGEG